MSVKVRKENESPLRALRLRTAVLVVPLQSQDEVIAPLFGWLRIPGNPESGYLTPVSVVSYEIITSPGTLTSLDDARYLVRRLNWGEQDQVARIDSLEIRYFVGSTVGGPVSRNPPLRRGGPGIQSKRGGPDAPANGDEIATSVARCGETRLHHGQGPSGKRQAFRVADR